MCRDSFILIRRLAAGGALVCALFFPVQAQNSTYLGFDRNEYPGDASLKTLRQTFSYAGYWLNNPPGMKSNSWAGHRAAVESAGFGFLVLFYGRRYAERKSEPHASRLGQADSRAGAAAIRRRIPAIVSASTARP